MKLLSLIAPLALAAQAWGADAQLLGLLGPEAKMIAGIEVQQTKASPFGQFLLSQLGATAELDKLRSTIGFDPLSDFREMAVGSTFEGKAVIAGRGKFQPQLLNVMAAMAGFPTENYRGVALVGLAGATKLPGQDVAIAFLNQDLAVMGDRAQAKGAIDRWLTAGAAASALAGIVNDISAGSQAWVVATGLTEMSRLAGPAQGNPAQNNPMLNILDKIDRIGAALSFGQTVAVKGLAVTKSAEDAQALASVLQLFTTMAGNRNPLPAMPQISAAGNAVNFTMSMTEQQLENLIRPQPAVRASR